MIDLQQTLDKLRAIVERELPPEIEGFKHIGPENGRSILEDVASMAQELSDELYYYDPNDGGY